MSEITATWAREKAMGVLGDKVKKQIKQCDEAIKRAVKENKLSCSVGIYSESLTIKDLENRGFNVNKHTGDGPRESDYITISW